MATVIDTDRFRARKAARHAGGGDGGNMDDVLRRLGVVESLLADTREMQSAMQATLSHLASKADLHALETRIIRWLVGTIIASVSTSVSAAFAIAKFVI